MVTDYLMRRMLEKKGDESPLNEKLRLNFDIARDGEDHPMRTLVGEHNPVDGAGGVGKELGNGRRYERCPRCGIRRNE